jgi:hypothetical protein
MLRKITEAVVAEKEHRLALWELERSINDSEVGAASLAAWRTEIEAWEMDRSQCNPFQPRVGGEFFFMMLSYCSQLHSNDPGICAVRVSTAGRKRVGRRVSNITPRRSYLQCSH